MPAFVATLPVNVANPPAAIAEPATGVQSSAATPVGDVPVAGIAVNNETDVCAVRQRVAGQIERKLRCRRRGVGLENRRRFSKQNITNLQVGRRKVGHRGAGRADKRLWIAERNAARREASNHPIHVVSSRASAEHHAEPTGRSDARLRAAADEREVRDQRNRERRLVEPVVAALAIATVVLDALEIRGERAGARSRRELD